MHKKSESDNKLVSSELYNSVGSEDSVDPITAVFSSKQLW